MKKHATGYLPGLNRHTLLGQLLTSARQQFQTEEIPSFAEWALGTPIMLDGAPFSFVRHEYLEVPYNDPHPDQVEMKSTQMGCTTRAMLRALYGARYLITGHNDPML